MNELAVKSNAELPNTWTVAAIGDIAVLSPKSDFEGICFDEPVHFIPMAAVSENFGGIDTSQLRPFGEVRKGYMSFTEGDVLFAKITPCMENGKGGLVPHLQHRYGFGSTEFHVLKATRAVLPTWLEHYLSQPDFRKVARHNMTGTAGQMRVPSSWLGIVGIPVAPVAEQARIVEKLEELLSDLDAGVAELKAAQKKLGQYRQSLLKAAVEGALTAEWRAAQKVAAGDTAPETGAQLLERILTERRARWEAKQLAKFAEQCKAPPKDWQEKYPEPKKPDTIDFPELPEDWVWSSIGECFYVGVGATPSRKEPNYWSGEIPWVSSGEVQFSRITKTKERITPEGLKNSSTQINPVGSVMLGMIGEGKTRGQVSILDIGAANNQNCAAIWVSDTEIQSEFVYYWLWSQYEQTRRGSSGNNQPALNKSIVESIPLPLPPLHELKAIVALVSASMDQIQSQEQSLAISLKQSAAQRKNILKAAFSGQLVPQDPNDEPASVLLERIRAERAEHNAVKKPRGRKARQTA